MTRIADTLFPSSQPVIAPIGIGTGIEYYVDGNGGSDGNDGRSWSKAYKTLAFALAVSHANIALTNKWAQRNTIYIIGDAFVEDLTKLAQKTDIVGCGSYNHHQQAGVTGNHVIDGTSYMGCRFINVQFNAAAGVIMTIPATMSGMSFLNCTFDSGAAATTGILATQTEQMTIKGCRFTGQFSTAAISLGAGASNRMLIEDNIIESGAIGILINASFTCANSQAIIQRNTFAVVTLVVDDNSSKVMIVNNQGRTDAAKEIATVLDCNVLFCANNHFGNATANGIYPARAAIV